MLQTALATALFLTVFSFLPLSLPLSLSTIVPSLSRARALARCFFPPPGSLAPLPLGWKRGVYWFFSYLQIGREQQRSAIGRGRPAALPGFPSQPQTSTKMNYDNITGAWPEPPVKACCCRCWVCCRGCRCCWGYGADWLRALSLAAQMDRRHWWLVSKLQDSFGDALRSSRLEAFLCQPSTLPLLQAFTESASTGGPRALFVWNTPRRHHSNGPSQTPFPRRSRSRGKQPDGDNDSTLGRERHGRDSHAEDEEGVEEEDAEEDGTEDDRELEQIFLCGVTPPTSFAHKCVYFLWMGPATLGAAEAARSSASLAPDVSSKPMLPAPAAGLAPEIWNLDAEAPPISPTRPAQMEDTSPERFSASVVWGEVEPELGAELRVAFLSMLMPRLATEDWGACSEESLLNLKTVRFACPSRSAAVALVPPPPPFPGLPSVGDFRVIRLRVLAVWYACHGWPGHGSPPRLRTVRDPRRLRRAFCTQCSPAGLARASVCRVQTQRQGNPPARQCLGRSPCGGVGHPHRGHP